MNTCPFCGDQPAPIEHRFTPMFDELILNRPDVLEAML